MTPTERAIYGGAVRLAASVILVLVGIVLLTTMLNLWWAP